MCVGFQSRAPLAPVINFSIACSGFDHLAQRWSYHFPPFMHIKLYHIIVYCFLTNTSRQEENCPFRFLPAWHPSSLQIIANRPNYGFPKLRLTQFDGVLMKWRLHSNKAVALVGWWSLFLVSRTSIPYWLPLCSSFLFCFVFLPHTALICDCNWLDTAHHSSRGHIRSHGTNEGRMK